MVICLYLAYPEMLRRFFRFTSKLFSFWWPPRLNVGTASAFIIGFLFKPRN